jgi:hypothetical protein
MVLYFITALSHFLTFPPSFAILLSTSHPTPLISPALFRPSDLPPFANAHPPAGHCWASTSLDFSEIAARQGPMPIDASTIVMMFFDQFVKP